MNQEQQKKFLKANVDAKRESNAPDLMAIFQYNLKEMVKNLK